MKKERGRSLPAQKMAFAPYQPLKNGRKSDQREKAHSKRGGRRQMFRKRRRHFHRLQEKTKSGFNGCKPKDGRGEKISFQPLVIANTMGGGKVGWYLGVVKGKKSILEPPVPLRRPFLNDAKA